MVDLASGVSQTDPRLTNTPYIPPVRPNLIPRPHLTERLDKGLRPGRKLTCDLRPGRFRQDHAAERRDLDIPGMAGME